MFSRVRWYTKCLGDNKIPRIKHGKSAAYNKPGAFRNPRRGCYVTMPWLQLAKREDQLTPSEKWEGCKGKSGVTPCPWGARVMQLQGLLRQSRAPVTLRGHCAPLLPPLVWVWSSATVSGKSHGEKRDWGLEWSRLISYLNYGKIVLIKYYLF